jgi:hypothetical protein
MPKGLEALQTVTAAPPTSAIRLIVASAICQNAIICPSGENTGFRIALPKSVPAIGCGSASHNARVYSC